MSDPDEIIPGDMPFTIYADPQYLDWSDEELEFFNSNKQYEWLTRPFPGGIHIKPQPGNRIKLGWAFQTEKVDPQWQPINLDLFPQTVLKGASRFIPGLQKYQDNIPSPLIEYTGYYTRTEENWPLIGPTEIDNIYVLGALAGFGTMAACAAGELCANYLFENRLPDYADYFHPQRYKNPTIVNEIKSIRSDGQL